MSPLRSRDLIAAVNSDLRSRMPQAGWRRRTDRHYTLDITPDVIGAVGFNRAAGRSDAWLELNPMLAVRHQPLERNVAELLNERFHPYSPGTVAANLGYLMPQNRYTPWIFTAETNVEATVQDFTRALDQYGLPFLRTNSTLETLVQTMNTSRFRVNLLHCFRVPVANAMLGRREEALRELWRYEEMPVEKRQVSRDRYSEFATAFRRRFVLA